MKTTWHSEDVLQVHNDDGELILEAFWNGGEWIAFAYENGNVDHAAGQMYIEIDATTEVRMREEEQAILAASADHPTERDVKLMELTGRRRMFRDDPEHRELVRLRARDLARRYLRDGTLRKEG